MARLSLSIIMLFLLTGCITTGLDDPPSIQTTSTDVSPTHQTTVAPSATQGTISPTVTQTRAETSPAETPTLLPTPSLTSLPSSILSRRASLPDPDAYSWVEVVAGLRRPVGLAFPEDGSGRMFIIEQKGRVLLKDHKGLDHNDLLTVPFLDIIDRVGSQGSEQGLLGLAFHPQYHENGYLFVNYTDHKGDTIVSRFSRSADDPNRADPESEVGLLRIPQPYGNHNGGMLAFGVDGYLYIGLGDGGSAGDPAGNGQSLASLLGKLLRIDVDGGEPYSIPADNPFAGGGGRPEIWLYGLRNPWRFAFDRLTGDLYIGDVGQNQWEEVKYLQAGGPGGANLGWNYFEGNHPYSGAPPAELNFVSPVLEYGREQGCSITGGVVYRGAELPEWQGVYLYGDYCTGRVWGLIQDAQTGWDNALLFDGLGRISSFGEDEAGEIYLVDHGGRVLRLTKK